MGNLTFRVNACLGNLSIDGVLAAADRLVLVVHDGSGARRSRITQVARKARNSGDNNDDTELAAFLASPNTRVNNSSTDLVVDGMLLVASSGN